MSASSAVGEFQILIKNSAIYNFLMRFQSHFMRKVIIDIIAYFSIIIIIINFFKD